jgi:hypothetical protein
VAWRVRWCTASVSGYSPRIAASWLASQPPGRPQSSRWKRGVASASPSQHLRPSGDARVGQPVASLRPSPWRRASFLDGGAVLVADAELGDRPKPVRQCSVEAQRKGQYPRHDAGAKRADQRVGRGGDGEGAVGEAHHQAADRAAFGVVGVRCPPCRRRHLCPPHGPIMALRHTGPTGT